MLANMAKKTWKCKIMTFVQADGKPGCKPVFRECDLQYRKKDIECFTTFDARSNLKLNL